MGLHTASLSICPLSAVHAVEEVVKEVVDHAKEVGEKGKADLFEDRSGEEGKEGEKGARKEGQRGGVLT